MFESPKLVSFMEDLEQEKNGTSYGMVICVDAAYKSSVGALSWIEQSIDGSLQSPQAPSVCVHGRKHN